MLREHITQHFFTICLVFFHVGATVLFRGEAVEVFVSVRLVLYVSSAECIGELERLYGVGVTMSPSR